MQREKAISMTSVAWDDDLLDRKSDAVFLMDFLVRKIAERGRRGGTKSFVLNIDAEWGQGKSYFLDNMRRMLEEQQYVVAYVNAWTDDHADDPLIAVMAAIEAAVNGKPQVKSKKPLKKLTQIGGQLAAAATKGLIKQAAQRYLGEDAWQQMSEAVGAEPADALKSASQDAAKKMEDLYDSEGKALLEKFHVGQRTITEFKKLLAEVVASFKAGTERPLFILIDELDRCRPPYAVALLERVKHLFDVDEVVFVMATDTEQLKHSIGALYGVNFAAGRYLRRFFDETYRFEEASPSAFVEQQFSDIDSTKLFASPTVAPAEFCAHAFMAFNLSFRDMQQCTDIIRNCVTVWEQESPLVLLALIPLVVLQQQRAQVSYGFADEQFGTIKWDKLDFNQWDISRNKKMFNGMALSRRLVGVANKLDLHALTSKDDDDLELRVCSDPKLSEARAERWTADTRGE